MAWATLKGFEFRATSGYVTTGTNHAVVTDAVAYPTTTSIGGESVTYGWESIASGNSRDRTTGSPNNPKLSGACFNDGTSPTPAVFRVDLPAAGDYSIRIAAGDFSVNNNAYFDVKDTNSVLISKSEAATGGADFYVDASLVARTSAADWIANNVAVTNTFATTIFRFSLNQSVGASVIAYIELSQAGGSATYQPMQYQRKTLYFI